MPGRKTYTDHLRGRKYRSTEYLLYFHAVFILIKLIDALPDVLTRCGAASP